MGKKVKTSAEKARQHSRTATNKIRRIQRAIRLTKSDKHKTYLEGRIDFWRKSAQ